MKPNAVILLAMVAIGVLPATSLAAGGSYSQIVCFNPDTGEGVGVPAEIAHHGGEPFPTLHMDCSGAVSTNKGIVMTAAPSSPASGDAGELAYAAPPGVLIESGLMYRVLEAPDSGDHGLTMAQHGGASLNFNGAVIAEVFDWHNGTFVDTGTNNIPWAVENRVSLAIDGPKAHWRYTGVCDKDSGCEVTDASPVSLRIFGGRLSLRDNSVPNVSEVGGSLVANDVSAGTQSVDFSATDSGSGLYLAKVQIDGVLRSTAVVDSNGGRCRDADASNADPYEFSSAAPCKEAASMSIAVDTRQLAEGSHTLRIEVEDAAGNPATVVDRMIAVRNLLAPSILSTLTPIAAVQTIGGVAGPSTAAGRYSLSFWLNRKRVRNGQTLRYSGKLDGLHSGRKFVEIQVRSGRRWQVVCSVQTDDTGRFGCRHRFRRTYVRTRYVFRARVRGQAGLSFNILASTSKSAIVRPKR